MTTPAVGEVMAALTPVSVWFPSFWTVTENCTVSPDSHRPLPLPPPLAQVSVTRAWVVVRACGPQGGPGIVRVRVQLSRVPRS